MPLSLTRPPFLYPVQVPPPDPDKLYSFLICGVLSCNFQCLTPQAMQEHKLQHFKKPMGAVAAHKKKHMPPKEFMLCARPNCAFKAKVRRSEVKRSEAKRQTS